MTVLLFQIVRFVILAGNQIPFDSFGLGLIEALVLAKVILIGDRFRLRVFHFTPTSASWILRRRKVLLLHTRRRIRRGVFATVAALQDAIRAYFRQHNRDPKPFVRCKAEAAL
jgi:hypothetical protein